MAEPDDVYEIKAIAHDDKDWYDLVLGGVVIATVSAAELVAGSPTLKGAQAAADRLVLIER